MISPRSPVTRKGTWTGGSPAFSRSGTGRGDVSERLLSFSTRSQGTRERRTPGKFVEGGGQVRRRHPVYVGERSCGDTVSRPGQVGPERHRPVGGLVCQEVQSFSTAS